MFGYIVLVVAIYLIIGFIVGKMMENAAADKGYGTEAHAFAMCFWLGIIGCIYVAALPDKIQQKQNQKIIDLLSAKDNNTTTTHKDTEPPIDGGITIGEEQREDDDSIHCPHCERKIIVPAGTMSAQCPWCGKNIIF